MVGARKAGFRSPPGLPLHGVINGSPRAGAASRAGVKILSPRYSAVRDGNPSTVPRRPREGDRSEPSG